MSTRRSWLWSAFAVTLLAIPVAATLGARVERHPLPHLGQVPEFALVDQTGRPLRRADLDGQPWVADFVFTSCAEVCPRLTAEMANLQRYLQNRGARVHLVSITVDPERDTVERLAAYAAGFAADPTLWKFATGPADAVKDAVVRGFKVGIEREPNGDDFTILHGTRFVLIDGQGAIRGYYDAAEGRQMAALRADLERLAGRGGS
jgi:protein SCO1/2